ncbi:hypothetical protein EJ06DRAFT_524159 [Trichodelitschia bisporula]|uniref:Uncharacterized protein n=1 Tax=Trichodelitschia bisporula TaxID=703511 RepID=A0A6G1HMT4_9PEZI|nr:hypothetical protein EJ06DRAFT_524159 [Trichodelitschia bisporula]
MCARVYFVFRCCHEIEPEDDDFPRWVWVEFCETYNATLDACGSTWYETGSVAVDDICEKCKGRQRVADAELKAKQRSEAREREEREEEEGKEKERVREQEKEKEREERAAREREHEKEAREKAVREKERERVVAAASTSSPSLAASSNRRRPWELGDIPSLPVRGAKRARRG